MAFFRCSGDAYVVSLMRRGFLFVLGLVSLLFVRYTCCTMCDVSSTAGVSGSTGGITVTAQAACLVVEASREQSR